MAEASIVGAGVVWAVGDKSMTVLGVATNGEIQGMDLSKSAEDAALKDQYGDDFAMVFPNASRTLTLSVLPSNTTQGLTRTALALLLPAPGSKVVISDAETYTGGTSPFAGDYVCKSSSVPLSNTGEGVVSMELYLNETNDLTVIVS